MSMTSILCINCNKKAEHHAKQMCTTCYKKLSWKPKLMACARCGRQKPMHARGFCAGCYNSIFHLDKVKKHNARRYHNIDIELYKKTTKECISCGFNKIVELHHIDNNKTNNAETNLAGLCPNCHRLIHSKQYQKEIFDILKNKGFLVPQGYEFDGFFSKKFNSSNA